MRNSPKKEKGFENDVMQGENMKKQYPVFIQCLETKLTEIVTQLLSFSSVSLGDCRFLFCFLQIVLSFSLFLFQSSDVLPSVL